MSDRYEIVQVTDLFRVPPDKRDACLTDLRLWMEMRDALDALLSGVQSAEPPVSFIWIDDGKHDAHVSVSVKETGEVLFDRVFSAGDPA